MSSSPYPLRPRASRPLTDFLCLESKDTIDVSAHLVTASLWGLPLAQMRDCAQDPIYHGEGDVATHTNMALSCLVADPYFIAAPSSTRAVLFTATMFHDSAKPDCSKVVDSIIRSPGHSHRGEKLVRRVLWELGVDPLEREKVAQLVRWHQAPYHLSLGPDFLRRLIEISTCVSISDLLALSRADVTGRVASDLADLSSRVNVFASQATVFNCATHPFNFLSDYSRFVYFNQYSSTTNNPFYQSYEPSDTPTLIIMSGLPGSGKSSWAASSSLPVVSLDAIRSRMGLPPARHQLPVVLAAKNELRALLAKRESCVYDATSLTRSLRAEIISIASQYRSNVKIVSVETTKDELWKRNRARGDRALPFKALSSMIARWEPPTLSEASAIEWIYT